jgi:hypothetical protein
MIRTVEGVVYARGKIRLLEEVATARSPEGSRDHSRR